VTAEKLRGVDQLVHLAAIIPGKVPSDEGDASLWNVNVLGTQRLIEAMTMANAKRLVLTGTANVYEPDQPEASETSAFGPRSRVLYLASKAAQEWLAASMCNAAGIDCAILRISSVIGDGRGIIDRLALDLASGQQIQIQDGAAFGADFIDCDDVCKGLLLAVEAKLNGAYNLSSGKRTELLDIVLELAQNLGRGPEAIQMNPTQDFQQSILTGCKAMASRQNPCRTCWRGLPLKPKRGWRLHNHVSGGIDQARYRVADFDCVIASEPCDRPAFKGFARAGRAVHSGTFGTGWKTFSSRQIPHDA
jgi:nucleoside-diphosphate-sugar epimerase